MISQKDAVLGRIAVERGYLTQERVDQALEIQRKMHDELGMDQPLEQVLIGKHWFTPDQAQELQHAVAVETGEARLVAGYEAVSKLGQGGMGAVYKARRVGAEDFVALKVLPPSLADKEMIARFTRESEIVKKLHHDNIVGCIEFGFDGRKKCHFCALEFVEGEDLGKYLRRRGRLSEDEAVSITTQIAGALQHAYFNGLVHRDVKPENIMVTPDGTAKLLDLGLARPASKEATRLTESGLVVGSPYYISPEQAMAEREIDIRADIYSLGATLYHMVTGKPPFEGTTALAILQKHVTEKLPWPAEVNPELSDGLCRIIAKMMEKAPDDRYQTPNDLHRDLDLLVEGEEPEVQDAALKNSSVKVPAVRPRRRRRPGARARAARERDRKHRKPAERDRREACAARKKPESVRKYPKEARREVSGKASGWSALPTGAKIGIPVVAGLLAAVGLAMLLSGGDPGRTRPKPPRRQPGASPQLDEDFFQRLRRESDGRMTPERTKKEGARPPDTPRPTTAPGARKGPQRKPPPPPVVKPKPAPPGPTPRTVLGDEFFVKLRKESEQRQAKLEVRLAKLRELGKAVTQTGRAETYEQGPGADGLVRIEAEEFSAKNKVDTHDWEFVKKPDGYTGRGTMQALPDSRTQVGDDLAERCPRLDYKISFVKTGTHYLWVRMFGVDNDGDSCHGGLDGEAVPSLRNITTNTAGRYYWEGRRWGERATFEIAAAGVHTINIFMREDGTIVDALAVATNPKWTPAGISSLPEAAGTARKAPPTDKAPGEAGPSRGLVGWWKFGDGKGTTARDSSGHGNHGTVKGGAKWAKDRLGGALLLDGKDDYVDCGNAPSLHIHGDMTLSIWVKPDTISGERALASKWVRSWCWVLGPNGKNALYFDGWKVANTAVPVGEWSHLAVVYADAEDKMYFYYNGRPDGTEQQTVKQGTGANLTIGRRGSPPHAKGWFKGLIGDVRIYARALSAEQVRALHAAGLGPQPPTITSAAPEIAALDVPYTYKINATGNPEPTITVKGLPDWLKFDGKDTISGTPYTRHRGTTRRMTVAASNGAGATARQEFRINVMSGDPFGFRFGGARRHACLRGGGSKRSERAVDAGLRWLARNQEADGSWSVSRWEGNTDWGDVGVTGLGLLAFLGAGHTEKTGTYKETVRKAVAYLISKQNAAGAIGSGSGHWGYNHSIAGLAIAEAYGMARVLRTGAAAQKGVDWSINHHQNPYSGWRYAPKQSPDTSVTGWFIMQLKSAQIAGLRVDPKGFQGAIAWLDKVTQKPTGAGHGGRASYQPGKGPTPSMTSVAMLGRQFMGWKRTSPLLIGGANYLAKNLPGWAQRPGNEWMFYYWYYGTLVMFQMGGDWWKQWNASLRDMLIAHQIKKPDDPKLDGSWDPINDGARGGRAYSTALSCMCLEVYYRYRNLYE